MGELLARFGLSGDDHFASSHRGQHINYPDEVLYYQDKLIRVMKENGVTHWVKLGDLTYGNIKRPEYRNKMDDVLRRQRECVNGNFWYLEGNHDESSGGMTEYEYRLGKGDFKGKENLQIGSLNLSMVNYGRTQEEVEAQEVIIEEGKHNVICAHGYFGFKSSTLFYGEPIILDYMHSWYGAEYIALGHIHQRHLLKGSILSPDKTRSKECYAHYLPCLSRPSYFKGENPTEGSILLIDVYDDHCDFREVAIPLLPLAESFNLEAILAEEEVKERTHIDVKDIVSSLNSHDRKIGNPEDLIMSMTEYPINHRQKAVDFLTRAL